MPPNKSESTLRRGTACLSCRKRKLKCDGIRPVCRQCTKMNRANLCEYDDKQQKSRTQLLKEQLSQLEQRLQELETNNTPPPHFQFDFNPYTLDPYDDDPTLATMSKYHPTPLFNLSSSATTPSPTPSDSSSANNSLHLRPRSSYSYHSDGSPASNTTSLPGSPSHRNPKLSLSPRAKQYLMDVFISHRHQCWFYVSMDRFLDTTHSRHSEPPHPALLNAMYLLACHFSHTPMYTDMEPAFLTQVQHDINCALDSSDRLTDIVQASSLLAIYLYMNNRAMEGYRHTFSAIRLAVGLGLHQIQPPSTMIGAHVHPSQIPLIPISPPRDNIELNDRILAFWQVFMIDRCWSVVNDVPLALPDKDTAQCRIITPWPSMMESSQWHDSGLLPLRSFFEGSDLADASEQFVPALKVKAVALYELTSRSKHASDANDWGYRLAESAVQRFSLSLPTLPPDRDHFMIQTVIYASFIHLQRHVLFDPRAFKAGNSIVRLIHQLSDADWQYLDPIIAICWSSTAEMFMYTLATNTLNGDASGVVNACNVGLDVITHALNAYGTYSPLSRDRAVKLKLSRV